MRIRVLYDENVQRRNGRVKFFRNSDCLQRIFIKKPQWQIQIFESLFHTER